MELMKYLIRFLYMRNMNSESMYLYKVMCIFQIVNEYHKSVCVCVCNNIKSLWFFEKDCRPFILSFSHFFSTSFCLALLVVVFPFGFLLQFNIFFRYFTLIIKLRTGYWIHSWCIVIQNLFEFFFSCFEQSEMGVFQHSTFFTL